MPKEPSIYDQIARLAGQVGAMPTNSSQQSSQIPSTAPHHTYPRPFRGRGHGWSGIRGFRGPRGSWAGRGSYKGGYGSGYRGGFKGGGYRGSYGPYASRGAGRRGDSQVPRGHSGFPCADYTRTGKCEHAKTCRFNHDPNRVALCIPFLKTGKCPNATCTLSHERKPENTPMCTHFASGSCRREDCHYLHQTRCGPEAPVCPEFARSGWCKKGAECARRHEFECPEFDATGKCETPHCHLRHVTRNKRLPGRKVESEPREARVDVGSVLALLDEYNDEDSGHSDRDDGEDGDEGEDESPDEAEDPNQEDSEEKYESDYQPQNQDQSQSQSQNQDQQPQTGLVIEVDDTPDFDDQHDFVKL